MQEQTRAPVEGMELEWNSGMCLELGMERGQGVLLVSKGVTWRFVFLMVIQLFFTLVGWEVW